MSATALPMEHVIRDFILLISPYVEDLGYHDIQSLCKEILSLDACVDEDTTPFSLQSALSGDIPASASGDLTIKSLMATLESCKGQASKKRAGLLAKSKPYQLPFVSQNEKTNHQVSPSLSSLP